jgi:CBS domain-containing protein
MADTHGTHEVEIHQLATQAPGETVQPLPPAHESRAAEKHTLDNDATDAIPHKRYRSEPHHSVLLTNDTETKTVLSPSQYVPDFLKSKTALSIIPEEDRGKIETIYANHVASEALSMLSKHNILSVPVYDRKLEAYMGFVDYLDLASLVVDIVHRLMKAYYPEATISTLQTEQKSRLVHDAKQQFNLKTLLDISDLSKNDPYMPILKSANLYQAIEILAKFGIHRVPIIDDEHKIDAILSQSAVLDFLYSNLDKFSNKAKKPVSELLSNRADATTVLTMPESAPAFEAFELMLKHRVSAVGIVDESGSLVGVISGTDLRIIGPHCTTLGLLLNPVRDLLDQSRELNTAMLVPVVKATFSDTLGIVIESMEDNKVHRVFVVNEDDKPVCVLSMKDVLNEFLNA